MSSDILFHLLLFIFIIINYHERTDVEVLSLVVLISSIQSVCSRSFSLEINLFFTLIFATLNYFLMLEYSFYSGKGRTSLFGEILLLETVSRSYVVQAFESELL